MPRKATSANTDRAIPAVLRRRFSNPTDVGRNETAARSERAGTLNALSREYRNQLRSLLGKDSRKEHNAMRKRLAKASRAVRRRETDALLCRIGFDRLRAKKLRDEHSASLRALFDDSRRKYPIEVLLPPRCSPSVEYRAPFAGEFTVPWFSVRGDVNQPDATTYVNRLTGQIGSRVRARLSGAGDDDGLDAAWYTAFRMYHTTLATGVLDVDLDCRIRTLRATGKVTDEWGLSNATWRQTVRACLRVMTVTQPDESLDSVMINHMSSAWGDDAVWNLAGNSGDGHSYRFRTATSYPQGTILIMEVGVRNEAWFDVNDMSIDMTADADLVIERVRVRSCP